MKNKISGANNCCTEPLLNLLFDRFLFSELGFIVSFVWVRAIYCFLNQSCKPFLELPAHSQTRCILCVKLVCSTLYTSRDAPQDKSRELLRKRQKSCKRAWIIERPVFLSCMKRVTSARRVGAWRCANTELSFLKY